MDKVCQYLSKFLFRSIVPCLTEIIHVPLSLCLATQLEANFGKYLDGRAGLKDGMVGQSKYGNANT